MDKQKNYEVVFSGLKEGKHKFQFEINEEFFQFFDTELEFSKPRLVTDVILEKHSTFLEFWISTSGLVELTCDISNDNFDCSIQGDTRVLVKFGEEYDDSNEEVIVLPNKSHAFNIAQLVYEEVILAIPMKKISPKLNQEDLTILNKYQSQEIIENQEENNDPRWDALKKLKENN